MAGDVMPKMRIGPTLGGTHHYISADVRHCTETVRDMYTGEEFTPTRLSAEWRDFRDGKGWRLSRASAQGRGPEWVVRTAAWSDIAEVPQWVRGWMWLHRACGIQVFGFEDDE